MSIIPSFRGDVTRHDAADTAFLPDRIGWDEDGASRHVMSPTSEEQALTWPSAVWPAQNGYAELNRHGQLTLNALLASDLPRPATGRVTAWPGWTHVWPGVGIAAWSGLGFWAHTEPLHALMAAGFGTAGTVFMGFGAFGTMVGNLVTRDADAEPADRAGTRTLLGIGAAAFSGAASTGAGFSGIGCMLAAGSAAAVYGGKWAWQQYARHRAIRAVIDFAAASNPGPLPPGMPLPLPPIALPDNRLPANPYEHRLRQAVSMRGVDDIWFGHPAKITQDTWRLPFELGPTSKLSPQDLAKKEDQLATNSGARRIEVDPTHGPKGTMTVYDGPDRTEERFEWNGAFIKSVEKPFAIGFDEAGRPTEIDFTEHILITGRTRMGKSALLRYLMVATLECQVVRLGIDCKDGAPGLGMLEPIFHKLATDPMDAWRMQFGIKAISAARGQRMRERGIDEWDLADGPRVVSVIDELIELTLRYPQASEILKSNLTLVAASKITLVNAAQAPPVAVWGKDTTARKQHGKRIGFKNDAEANPMTFGGLREYRLQDLDAAGQFLIASLDHMRPRRHKAILLDRDAAVELVKSYADRMPQLDTMSAEAFEDGMAAFDEAIAAGEDPLETFEPPPSGGGGHRTGRVIDSAQAEDRRHGLRLVTCYPNTDERVEMKHLALWNLLGNYGPDGATAMDLAAQQLDGFTSESNVRKQLNVWASRGFVTSEKDGRAQRWWRIDAGDAQDRRGA